ncbi:hypothetical protein [Brevibacillus massiliensis]|uniref:hypothetical protein n=1 Tax=Brevibacillus massiliensis TaxID=1118054 RepID=UPI0011CA63A8|nr:hypothetical protein [Brevibacillus massiliensis]
MELQPNPDEGEWDLTRKAGYYVVPWNTADVTKVVESANGNPDWVLKNKSKIPREHIWQVDGSEWVAFGDLVRLSGGGSPNQTKPGDRKPGGGVSEPLYHTTWQTTAWPVYNSITLNSTQVAKDSKVTNQLFIAAAGKPLNVVVNSTTYGINGTVNTLKTYVDGKLEPSLGGSSTQIAYGAAPYSWKFTISDPALLKSGDIHTITFEARDDYGRSTPIEIKYKVDTTQECTDWVNATLQLPGQSNKSIPSGGEYKLPAGVNTVTLSFPHSGTLKMDGVDYGSGNTFSNILIKGPTTLFYKSADEKECWTKDIYPEAPPIAECDPAQSKLSLHVWMFGSRTDRDVNLPSGSPGYALPTDVHLLTVEAPGAQKGSFYLNGVLVAENVGSHDFSVSRNDAITIKYVSKDGRECWIKTFVWDGQVSCPIVYQNSKNGRQISDGSTIEVELGGSLSLFARFKDTDGTMADAYLYWEVYRPGDTVPVVMDMVWEDKIRTVPTNNLKLPAIGYDDRSIVFDRPGGIYRIKLRYDGQYEKEWQDCKWEITVRVVGTTENICKNSEIEAWLDSQTELPMSKNADGNYALTIMPGSHVSFEAFYDKKTIPWPEWTLRNSSGQVLKSTTNITNFLYTFTDKDTYTLTAKYQIKSSVGVIDCSKTVTINVKTIDCEEISFNAAVDGRDTRIQGSSPYTIRLERGLTNQLVLEAVYPQSNVTVTGDWVLKKNGTTLRTVVGKNPFSHTFDDKTDAVYTLEATVYVNGEPCRKTFQIELKGLKCADISLNMKNSASGFVLADLPNGGKEKIVGVQVNVTFWLSKTGNRDEYINAVWSGPYSNASPDPKKEYTMTGLPIGSYTVTAKVDDSRYPSLNDCTFTFTVEITDQKDCSGIYLHLVDSASGGWTHNVDGKTIYLKGSSVTFGLLLLDEPNRHEGTTLEADWSGPRPSDSGEFGYLLMNAPPGTYTIKAVVTDKNFPNAKGCIYTVTVVISDDASPPDPPPGGDVDGGQVRINIYDSENRLLVSPSDGVWEREPARIEVVIDQGRIDAAFSAIDDQINTAIQHKVSELYSRYSGAEYEDVQVTADPPKWTGKTSAGTKWPSLELTVTGPGQDQRFSLNPKQASQSNLYAGTVVPTQTTWRQALQTMKYSAAVDSFTIQVPYQVDFEASFQQCVTNSGEDDGDPPEEKWCTPGRDSDRIAGLFAIVVKGDETRFEVFEPNAKGIILHTDEWSEFHQRDRYKDSQPHDFYAGERILAHLQLESRHKHPVSGKYPRIESAAAWISETGRQSTTLQSKLSLVAKSSTLWTGPGQMIEKLGLREAGVDTPLMGDKQKGFQKDRQYAVYFSVQFGFQVNKGFAYPDKTRGTGHDPEDYRAVFRIIANAWERQGIRNHTTH